MKRLKSMLVTLAMLLCTISASAHDFYMYGIYYNITDSEKLTVEVTYRGSTYNSSYSGDVVIPETVTYGSKTYAVTSIGEAAFYESYSLTSVTIPNSVTSIGIRAFEYCRSLTSVSIGDGVTSIGDYAFYDCSSLTSVNIPNSVTSICDYAFAFCTKLSLIAIGNGVTSIGDYAFRSCSSLTSVSIPNSVTSIDGYPFEGCSSLTSVHISDIAAWCNIKFSDYKSNPLYYANHLYMNGKEITELIIPDSVTSIGDYAFENCSSLTSVTIPNSVTSIGGDAFSYCTSLTSVHISDIAAWCNIKFSSSSSNPLNYAKHLYMNGKEITELKIPDGVTSIGGYAFINCSSLTSVTIPNSVTSIGDYAFRECSSLTSVTIPNSVTSIGDQAFYGCCSLTSVSIPNSVTSIDGYTFYGCSSLISVTIPNSVTSIGSSAFSSCSSLTSVTIPNSVTNIGRSAFSGCSSLNEITCKAETPPTTGTYVFEGIDKTIPLYVPKGSVLKYKAAANWKDFVIIREIAETETDVYLTITDCANGNVKLKVDEDKPYFTLKIEAETGWHVHSVTFNDGDVTAELSADGEYTTPAIGTDSRLNIVYAQGSSSVNSVSDSKIKVWASGNNIIVDNAILNETINVYTLDGMKITSVNANSNRVEIPLTTGVVYIVKVADKVLKVAL